MAGVFVCPYCGAATQVAPEFAGRSGPCAHCGRQIFVPAGGGEIASEPAKPAGRSRGNRTAGVLALIGALMVLIVIALAVGGRIVVDMLHAKLDQERCAERLRRIGVALQAYHDEYSAYPPIVVRGQDGKAWHSWRVLLLPHLGKDEEAIYKDYRFDEPWNGPHNRELAELMPAAYGCPCDPAAFDLSQTSYLAVVDPASGDFAATPTMAEANQPPSAKPAAAPKTRYLIVEVCESGVNWLEPRDLVLGGGKTKTVSSGVYSYHVGGVNAMLADGTTESMSEEEAARAFGSRAP